jgi:uncharacterized protein
MNLQTTTYKAQSQLAEYCRTGIYSPIPGVNERNIHRYRDLIYNIIDDSIQAAFPLSFNLLKKEEWEKMIKDFFGSHYCQSPQIWQMPGELITFLDNSNYKLLKKYPFLKDLLLFEWFEVELYMMEDLEVPTYKTDEIYIDNNLVLNPELKILILKFPVHLKNATEIIKSDKGQFFVCMHREPESGRIEFSNLQYPHVELLESLSNSSANFNSSLKIFTKYTTKKQAKIELTNFINASIKSRLILGYESSNKS